MAYGNGAVATYDYTKRGDLEVLDWDLPNTANDFAYSFTYNGAGQTTMAGYTDETLMWTPAAASIGTTDAYGVNGLNQYTSVGVGATTPEYDGNGNLATDYRDYDYFYSAENVLRVVRDEANSNIGVYYVHGDGTRRLKDAGGVSSNFYYWGDQEVLETETVTQGTALDIASHPVRRRYIRLPGATDEVLLMLSYVDEGATDCSNGCQTWAHHNRLGSVAKTTGFNGMVVKDSFRYSPYGESGTEGDLGFPFRFTGQKLDPETGLYYYKARYHSTETGRFLQTDPVGYEDQMNLYAYAYNDPVNRTDPTGKFVPLLACAATPCGAVVVAGATATAGAIVMQGVLNEVEDTLTDGEDGGSGAHAPRPLTDDEKDKVKEAGAAKAKGGRTAAGRSIQKRRSGGAGATFPSDGETAEDDNAAGERALGEITDDPDSTIAVDKAGQTTVIAPDGRRARLNSNGTFQGFRSPPKSDDR